MIKETNVIKSVVLPKDIVEKIKEESKKLYCSQCELIRRILIEYFKSK